MQNGQLGKQYRHAPEPPTPCASRLEEAVSVLKQAERKLVEALSQSESANRDKSEFLAAVSHEMRTPLGAIIGYSKLLAADPSGEAAKTKTYARYIQDAGEYLLDLVNDILTHAIDEAGPFDIALTEADLPSLVTSCMPLVEQQAQAAGVRLSLEIAPDFPPIVTDPRRLKQVLLNLVGNAIKFTDRGGSVTVKAWIENDSSAYILVVSDTGLGMARDDIERVMGPRHQAAERGRGRVGLGLPLTRRIVESLGGTLHIRSKPGDGTVVTLHFPHARADHGGRVPS